MAALRKDVQDQMRAVQNGTKLSRAERAAKLHEIGRNERARVNEILIPVQKQKLKDVMYPKSQWVVRGYITEETAPGHYTAHLVGYPPELLSFTIRKQSIRLRVLDAGGKVVPDAPQLTLAPNVPDIIKPDVDESGSGECQVEFTLDQRSARAGFYTFQLRAAVDATDADTCKRVTLRDASASQRVYVAPLPDAEPALRPGQRFIGTPWEQASASTPTAYRDLESGKPLAWREIVTKVATLQRVEPSEGGGKRLTFVLEGHTGQICLETGGQVTDLPYLTPLVTDPVLKALKAQYEGKKVWCYGGPGAQRVCTEEGMSISVSGRPDVPLRIRRVERAYIPHIEMAIGRATFIGGDRQSAFTASHPLVVILDAPANGLSFSGLSYASTKDGKDVEEIPVDVVSHPKNYCLGLWNMVCDRWDFERDYSLCNPFKAHPAWPASMRNAVMRGEIVKGMTHDMAAWAIGWPSIYGTKSEMLGINDWIYDNIPFEGHVYFKNGRVTRQDWPRLP